MKISILAVALAVPLVVLPESQTTDLKIGIIGTDTSHVTAFTKLLNDKSDPGHLSLIHI